jgi:hypothetical protein
MIKNALRFALGIFRGKTIYNFVFVALCGVLQTHFHEKGRNGKQVIFPQRNCFRRKRALQLPVSVTNHL